MFKFVTADVGITPVKRKLPQRACERCRKSKKRCNHTSVGSSEDAERSTSNRDISPASPADPLSTIIGAQSPTIRTTISQQSTASLIPERPVTIHDADEERRPTRDEARPDEAQPNRELLQDAASRGSLDSRFVGDLNPESIFLSATSPSATRGVSSDEGIGVWLAKELHKPQQTSAVPRNLSLNRLFYGSTSWIPKILMPVLEGEILSILPPPGSLNALSNLYFEKMHSVLPLIERDALWKLPQTDSRYILLQQGICLAASKNFAAEHHRILPGSDSSLSCREFGSRLSSAMKLVIEMGLVTDKIVLIQALALMSHFSDGPDNGDNSSQLLSGAIQHVVTLGLHVQGRHESHAEQYDITLLCCIWALDRMNAAFHGRPTMFHERDLRPDLKQCFEQQPPCFRLLLEVLTLLDKVIELYRPLSYPEKPVSEIDFPSFEELAAQCTPSQVPTTFLATIETLYHAAAMLSYRSKTWERPQRSSISFLRQSLASSRVSTTTSHEVMEQLVLFPFVPYSFSLSLSVAYREMRYSKMPMSRARARTQFQSDCDVLTELGEIFFSASTMAEMGRSTLKEMDRVLSVAAVSEQRRLHQDDQINPAPGTEMEDGYVSSVNPPEHPTQPMQAFDPLPFDSISDMDLFGMFDPSFDLNSIDACLEGNLNLSFPTQFQ